MISATLLLLTSIMQPTLVSTDLRCENLTHPLGIDQQKPRLSWKVAASQAGLHNLSQSAYRILVATDRAHLSEGKADLWDSGRIASADTFGVEYAGKALKSGEHCWWTVQTSDQGGTPSEWTKAAEFSIGLLEPEDWHADWIGFQTPDGASDTWIPEIGTIKNPLVLRPATYFRKDFAASSKLKRATAYVTALGLVDLHINGKRVSDDLFTPGWTDYDKRVYYRTYDVTYSINEGQNAVGAILGDGWYSGYVGYGGHRAHYGDRPRVRVQIDLEYSDGRVEHVGTSSDWHAGTGPVLQQDFLMGETYDARLEAAGWDKPGFKAAGWQASEKVNGLNPAVEAYPAQPVRAYQHLKAKTVTEPRPGVFVIDFGQNLAGFVHLKLQGKPGQHIGLRFAERVNADGTLYVANLRGARATDNYICKGTGVEDWEPRFTFHGFQYAEVIGLSEKPGPDDVVAVAISNATPEVGHIETSDPMINRLSANAWWTQKMNFIDIPTDCPQRDERLGWTGDAQAYIRTACSFSDVQAFFTKWLVALDDDQRADGQFPMVAPTKVAGDDGGPAWADAGVICPWTIYHVYGDKHLLAQHYPAMRKFVEFTRKRCTADLLPPEKFHCFGDWVNVNSPTPPQVIFEAYFAYSTHLVAESARALGYEEDARRYDELFEKVKAAFNKEYVAADGVVAGNTQCSYVLALAFDLLDTKMAEKAAAHLVADIESRGWHLSTGFVGTRDIMQALSKIGRNDVAFRLLHNTTYPSWGFEVEHGATSIWERWDAWTPDKGLQDPDMNSFAHYAYGAVMGWVFQQVGGIDTLEPGFGKIRIAPQIDPHLTWAKTHFDSVRGRIGVDWKISQGKLELTVEIPPNTTAEVAVPTRDGGEVRSDSAPIGLSIHGATKYSLGSGKYLFTTEWPE